MSSTRTGFALASTLVLYTASLLFCLIGTVGVAITIGGLFLLTLGRGALEGRLASRLKSFRP